MTNPQIHDRVLYHPAPDDKFAQIGGQPLAAIVCGNAGGGYVNLVIFDAYGLASNRTEVLFVPHPGNAEVMLKPGRYCTPVPVPPSNPWPMTNMLFGGAHGGSRC